MPAQSWTTPGPGEDEEFILSFLDEYASVMKDAEQRKTNHPRDALLERIRVGYEERYVGRSSTWRFSKLGDDASEDNRKDAVRTVSVYT